MLFCMSALTIPVIDTFLLAIISMLEMVTAQVSFAIVSNTERTVLLYCAENDTVLDRPSAVSINRTRKPSPFETWIESFTTFSTTPTLLVEHYRNQSGITELHVPSPIKVAL